MSLEESWEVEQYRKQLQGANYVVGEFDKMHRAVMKELTIKINQLRDAEAQNAALAARLATAQAQLHRAYDDLDAARKWARAWKEGAKHSYMLLGVFVRFNKQNEATIERLYRERAALAAPEPKP